MKSPVQLTDYRIKRLHFDLEEIEEGEMQNSEFSTDVDYDIFSFPEDEEMYRLELRLNILPSDSLKQTFPFRIELVVDGLFLFIEGLEEKEKNYHLNISCSSMLYGAARSIIHQITGQTNYGSFTIPSIQFAKLAEEKFSGEKEG